MLRLLFYIAAIAFLGQMISCLAHGDYNMEDEDENI